MSRRARLILSFPSPITVPSGIAAWATGAAAALATSSTGFNSSGRALMPSLASLIIFAATFLHLQQRPSGALWVGLN